MIHRFVTGALLLLVFAVSAPAAEVTTRPTTGPALKWLNREKQHLQRIEAQLKPHPKLANNPYVRLELAVARRFIDRLTRGKTSGDESDEWRKLQMDEVKLVLDHTAQTIADVESGRLPAEGLGPVPVPTGGPVKIEDGVFVAETTLPGVDDTPKMRPFYFGGYGHFGQIFLDLPNFGDLGVTLIQDGRNGPAQGLKPDRTLSNAGRDVRNSTRAAGQANVKVDILTSPHYFPAWAVNEAPDMANGTAYNNIDHPVQRDVIEKWLSQLAASLKDEPALLSYCLSNEAVYSASGHDKYSAPAWQAFLKQRHGTIEKLNAIYESNYKRFEDVPAGGWADTPVGRRHAFDWVSFNDHHFAQWHKWMGDILKKQDPRALTHAKIMVFFSLDPDKLGWGVDPEQFCLATDIAGCDAYAQMGVGVGPLDESTSKEYAYNWQVEQMFYDLMHSFANQPVFNSENHPMPNATGAYPWPAKHTRAVMWQGGLHHQGATTTWVWEEGVVDSLLHTIYFRPAHIWAQGRAMLDLNRLSKEVTAINRAPAPVALLYSPPTRFWEADYGTTMRTLYTALTFLGQNITFVSENQLAAGRLPRGVRCIVLPHATSVTDATVKALGDFAGAGGTLLAAGRENLAFDEYHRPRRLPDALASLATIDTGTERGAAEALRPLLPPNDRIATLTSDSGGSAWGVEYRSVDYEGGLLVPMINHLKSAQSVTLHVPSGAGEATDLLSGQKVSLKAMKLEPMEPMLLRILSAR